MSTGQMQQRFFDNGKLNIRKLRHDLSGTLGVVQNMIHLSAENPVRRAEYDVLLKKAVERLVEIRDALLDENLDPEIYGNSFVEVMR